MRGATRMDAAVAIGFIVAGVAEAVVRFPATPTFLAVSVIAALALGVLAVRRRWPIVCIAVLSACGAASTVLANILLPHSGDSAGVWIFAMMLAAYSVGAYASGPRVLLGVLMPLAVALSADLPTMQGGALVTGILFVTGFVGVIPTTFGRLIRVRRERIGVLRDQGQQIVRGQQAEREVAALAARLTMTERVGPTLLAGLRALSAEVEQGTGPADVERMARELLSRTREEVIALTDPVDDRFGVGAPHEPPPPVNHIAVLRSAAQPWIVLAAGAIGVGFAVETMAALPAGVPGWVAGAGAVGIAAPLAWAWRWPVVAVAMSWAAASAYSRLLVPSDGTLSEVALVAATAFVVGALSRRWIGVAGLALVCAGSAAGMVAEDPLGEIVFAVVCWLAGAVANDVARIVEQTRANNALLLEQDAVLARQVAMEERLRLARELHDVVGHTLTVAALQAGAARRLLPGDPERAHEVMRTVATLARDGAQFMQRTHSASDLVALVEHARAAGLDVEADVGEVFTLDADESERVYRVVREALTNVLRHAPGAHAAIRVHIEADEIDVAIANSAPPAPGAGPGTGLGLPGIRDRVVVDGGRVSWGAREDGGFEVRALWAAHGRAGLPL